MIICFLVSSSILTFAGIVLVLLYKRMEPAGREDQSLKNIAKRFRDLNYTNRVVLGSSPFMVFALALVWRVWDVVMNDSTQIQCQEEGDGTVMLSSILPTWFAPFWIVSDYEMHIAVIPLRLTKMFFISAFLLSCPLILVAVHYISKSDEPILKLARWLIDVHRRWSKTPCASHLQRIVQLEWAEEQYMKTIIKATVACMEKEGEVKQLELKITQLENSIMEVNQWVNSERRLANSFDKKNRDIERKLQSEKRRSQSLESRCKDRTRELEQERKANTVLEKKIHEQQRKLDTLEKRPQITKVVKQQISGNDILCVICMERKRQYLLRPCNHYCVCNTCKSTLQNKCPLCRRVIQNYEKIYIN